MGCYTRILNLVVAAAVAGLWPGGGMAEPVEDLLAELQRPDQQDWMRIERRIIAEWSRSGSPTADLLLQRGRDALDRGAVDEAIEHLTALTDHAPDFAEGWHARATALYQRGLYGPALADLERALTLNPQHFGALTGVATIMEELDAPERALAAFRQAHAIHPHQPAVKTAIEELERQVAGQAT